MNLALLAMGKTYLFKKTSATLMERNKRKLQEYYDAEFQQYQASQQKRNLVEARREGFKDEIVSLPCY